MEEDGASVRQPCALHCRSSRWTGSVSWSSDQSSARKTGTPRAGGRPVRWARRRNSRSGPAQTGPGGQRRGRRRAAGRAPRTDSAATTLSRASTAVNRQLSPSSGDARSLKFLIAYSLYAAIPGASAPEQAAHPIRRNGAASIGESRHGREGPSGQGNGDDVPDPELHAATLFASQAPD